MPNEQIGLTYTKNEAEDLGQWVQDAEQLKVDVLSLAAKGTPHYPTLDRVFGSAFRKITAFHVELLPKAAFVFDPDTGIMTLNSQPLKMLFGYVREDALLAEKNGHPFPEEVLPLLLKKAFNLFVLHEVRHISQGIADYANVGTLKKIAGADFMAELDLIADRDAAAAYAALEADAEDGSRTSYLDHFLQALFFSGQYCFAVFRFTTDRPVKMARAVGLTLMAARLARADIGNANEEGAPLDGAIIVRLSDDYSSIVVVLSNPDTQVISIMCEVPDDRLKQMVDFIAASDFLSAVDIASVLLSTMKGLS